LTCRFGADLVFHEKEKSRVERAALYGMDELRRTFRDPATSEGEKNRAGTAPAAESKRMRTDVSSRC
jgi:hypothetical protein